MKLVLNSNHVDFQLSAEARRRFVVESDIDIFLRNCSVSELTPMYVLCYKDHENVRIGTIRKLAKYAFLDLESTILGFMDSEIPRDNSTLVKIVEEMGSDSWGCSNNGSSCSLEVVEIPDNISYHIETIDGYDEVCLTLDRKKFISKIVHRGF